MRRSDYALDVLHFIVAYPALHKMQNGSIDVGPPSTKLSAPIFLAL